MSLRAKIGRFLFGYDAVSEQKRRKSIAPIMRSEDEELLPYERRKLIATARDLPRNFSIAAWMVRKHLEYVSTFTFQARTGDDALDDALEEFVRWWSLPQNCDVSGRHSFDDLMRLAEALRTVDGDVLVNQIRDGRLQLVESDRIASGIDMPVTIDPLKVVHGVILDDFGGARGYVVSRREKSILKFDAVLSAAYATLHGYFTRYDQVRGVSPLAPAINSLKDVYECFDYALAKAKVSQMFALAFFRQRSDEAGITTAAEDEDGNETGGYEVDFQKGPIQLDLDPGDDAKFLESQTPASEFQAFTQSMIGVSLKSLDIPYSFYDEQHGNYSSSRLAGMNYEFSVFPKRAANSRLREKVLRWRLRIAQQDGSLRGDFNPATVNFQLIPRGVPWYDPLKEGTADINAIAAALKSPQIVGVERGYDPFEVVDQIAEFKKYCADRGVVPTWAMPAADANAQNDAEQVEGTNA